MDVGYFHAGSGHWTAAPAIQAALEARWPAWGVRAVDLVDVVAGSPVYLPVLQAGIDVVNGMLRQDRVFALRALIRLGLFCHDRMTPSALPDFARFWARRPPDAVVSVTPMNNGALYGAARIANPRVACVTVPVDHEEAVPGYWFTPGADCIYLLGSVRLAEQARRAGIAGDAVRPLSGMVVDPGCYAEEARPAGSAAGDLRRLGLEPGLPTVLVSFGAQGSVLVGRVARAIAGAGLRVNLLLLCGRSAAAAADLRRWEAPLPAAVLGLVDRPSEYRRLADVLVGKPGTMTIGEAAAEGRPLVAVRSPGMAPVQAENERWLEASGGGELVPSAAAVPAALARILDRPDAYRAAALRSRGNGVFELAAILGDLLGEGGVGAGTGPPGAASPVR